jgi:hypothetical protein
MTNNQHTKRLPQQRRSPEPSALCSSLVFHTVGRPSSHSLTHSLYFTAHFLKTSNWILTESSCPRTTLIAREERPSREICHFEIPCTGPWNVDNFKWKIRGFKNNWTLRTSGFGFYNYNTILLLLLKMLPLSFRQPSPSRQARRSKNWRNRQAFGNCDFPLFFMAQSTIHPCQSFLLHPP